jgi:hypothetical protein
VVAEMECAEMIDRLLNSIAWTNNENANGFDGECAGATERSCNIHRFCFELSRGWVRKPKNVKRPHGEA